MEASGYPWIGGYDTESEENFTNKEYYTTGGEESTKSRRTKMRTGHTLKLIKTKRFISKWIVDNDTTEWLEEFLDQQTKYGRLHEYPNHHWGGARNNVMRNNW